MKYGIPQYAENFKWKCVLLTPEWAMELLQTNHPDNRRMKETKIQQMASDILQGNWILTPEPIVISNKDRLIDGQNRCEAIGRAQIAVPVWLCSGVPEKVCVAMDCGATRNIADAARIMNKDIKSIVGVAGVAKRMAMSVRRDTSASLSIQETLNYIDVHKKAITFAYECVPSAPHTRGLTQAGVRGAIARAYYRRPVEETRVRLLEFGEVLCTGLPRNPLKDVGAIRLRNWLLSAKQGREGIQLNPIDVYAKAERAIEAFLAEEQLQQLYGTSNELFPLPGEKGNELESEGEPTNNVLVNA
jgi:hypothetical protein